MIEWKKAQLKAIEERDKLILVSAAAGSGKTAVLTERVIRRIIDPISPLDLTDLLIVTFTRSAAAELKSKIANALSGALEQDPGNTRLTEQLLQLGSAQISTIDSFFLQIVRSNFERLGLPANFRTAEENELDVLSGEIMGDLISDYYKEFEHSGMDSDEQNPFGRIRNNRFADCMDHIFEGTSGSDVGKTLIKFYQCFSRSRRGIELLNDSAENLFAESELPFPQTHAGKLLLSRLKSFVQSFSDYLTTVKPHFATDRESEVAVGGILADDLLQCRCVLDAIEKNDWKEIQKSLSAFTFHKFDTRQNKPEWEKRYLNVRNTFKDDLKTYVKISDQITPVEQKQVFSQTAELAAMLYRFYRDFQKRYRAEKLARGILDFNDVRDALLQMLTTPGNEEFVKSLQERYKEVYIDEYQDVDEIQDEIFAIIGGKNRFMVGDIKQIIYGFRGSDPTIFSGYRNAFPLSTSPEAEKSDSVCIFMSENFRCDQPIIHFTNLVCSFLFSASPKSVNYLPEDDLKYAKTDEKDETFPAPVTVRVFENASAKKSKGKDKDKDQDIEETEGSKNAEEKWVAAEISRLLREGRKQDGSPYQPSDIAVLARKTDYLKKFEKEFRAYDIPLVFVKGDSISRSPVFINLLNLLRAVDNPHRDLPLSEFLTTDWGGFTMDEVYRIRKEYSTDKSLYDALNAAASSESSLAPKATKFIEWLESYRRLAAVQSADRFLRILFQDAIFKDAVYSPEFLAVYDQARTYQQFSWTGLYGFLNYLTRLWDADKLSAGGFRKAESAVNAMTIHGAKGLEFPVVFVVGCGYAIKKTDKEKLCYQKGVGFASFLYHPETKVSSTSFLREINDFARSSAEAEEEVRLLYVAMTRAKEKLYITATPTRNEEEKVMTDASVIQRNDRFSILSGKSYIDWIYAALMQDPGGFWQIDFRYLSGPENTAPESSLQASEPDSQAKEQPDPAAEKYRNVLEKAKTFAYPLSALQGIPTKAAASKLKADLLDILKGEDQKAAISERISLMRGEQPDFQGLLDAQKRPTAAQIGSATHAFLALCDLPALSPETIEEEAARLVEQKFLSEETAKIVNYRILKHFAASPLMEKIKSAKEIYREKQFSLFVPLSELTKDRELATALSGQELFVQGSIDLLLLTEDGQIELYDYKTDRITDAEQNDPTLLREHLKERHGNQLQIYARAVEELFGKRPDRISIFALSIGEIVNLY